jgi:hypothetical protein
MPLAGVERAEVCRERRRFERENAFHRVSVSNAATAANSLMELHVEMRSADTSIDGVPTPGARVTAPSA